MGAGFRSPDVAQKSRRCGTSARRDASLGRIFEGHLNGAQLVARCGNAEQRAAALRAIADGHLFGVWNTQDADGVRIVTAGGRPRLSGAKTWASGAGSITRPVVTAAWPDGRVQMCLLRMDEIDAQIDGSAWQPLGMQASDSFRIGFDGVELTPFDLIGEPGDYEGQPWFLAGALRFAAVQTGIAERIVAETLRYLRARARDGDQMQCARVGRNEDRGSISALVAGGRSHGLVEHSTTSRRQRIAPSCSTSSIWRARSSNASRSTSSSGRFAAWVRAGSSNPSLSRASCAICRCICVNPLPTPRCCGSAAPVSPQDALISLPALNVARYAAH